MLLKVAVLIFIIVYHWNTLIHEMSIQHDEIELKIKKFI